MPRASQDAQYAVFNAFEDLRVNAAPVGEWQTLEDGGRLSWPSSLEGARDILWLSRKERFVWPIANLLISFGEEAETNFAFQRDIGKITRIHHTIGETGLLKSITAEVVKEVGRTIFRGERPGEKDYSILAQELQVGAAYYLA